MSISDLARYDVSGLTGFAYERRFSSLPERIALDELNRLCSDLPELSRHGGKELLRARISNLEKESFHNLMLEQDLAVKRLAFAQLSHLTAAYLRHVDSDVAEKRILPAVIALPLFNLAHELGHPAGLSHAYAVLCNWFSAGDQRSRERGLMIDKTPAVEDIDLLVKISNEVDYKWFFAVPARIEMDAGPGIVAGIRAMKGCEQGDIDGVCRDLRIIKTSLVAMGSTLRKMYINCRPNVFYHGFRRYLQCVWPFEIEGGTIALHGLFPGGDVAAVLPKAGATAAQSSALPFFDRLFAIRSSDEESESFLDSMLGYMPERHRQFLSLVRNQSRLSRYAREIAAERGRMAHREMATSLVEEYNACIEAIASFRTGHFEIVRRYIIQPGHTGLNDDSGVGTGGSQLQQFLQGLLQATKDKLVS